MIFDDDEGRLAAVDRGRGGDEDHQHYYWARPARKKAPTI